MSAQKKSLLRSKERLEAVIIALGLLVLLLIVLPVVVSGQDKASTAHLPSGATINAGPVITYTYPSAGGDTAWYNADPGAVIDIDFGSSAGLDRAQYRLPSGGWQDISDYSCPSGVTAYTATWAVNWPSTDGAHDVDIQFKECDAAWVSQDYSAGASGFRFLRDTVPPASSASAPDYDTGGAIAVGWTAGDATSGVSSTMLYVRKQGGSWANSGLPAQTGTSGTFYYTLSSDGTYYFQTVSTDHAGNQETAPSGSSGNGDDHTTYDTVEPASLASSPDYDTSGPIAVGWTASDATSGVTSTLLYVRKEGGSWADSGLIPQTGTWGTFNYTPKGGDGVYYFQTVSTDYAGNPETAPSGSTGEGDAQTIYDTTAPTSQVTRVPSTTLPGATFNVKWEASDATSALETTCLWTKFGAEASWTNTEDCDSGRSGQFSFTVGAEEGTYYFQTIATDKAGNVEAGPSQGGDAQTVVANGKSRVYLPLVLRDYTPPAPNLGTSTKTADKAAVNAGDTLRYTIVLSNSGSITANVTFSDPIPEGTTFVAGSAQGCDPNADQTGMEWSGTLPPTASHTCQFSVQVNAAAGGSIVNTATAYDGYHLAPATLQESTPVQSWHQGTGTAGWTFYSVAGCQDNPNVLYAGTRDHGVYKSSDQGAQWEATTLTGPKTGGYVWGVAVRPDSGCQTVYATTWGHGVQKTTDGGVTWVPVNSGLGDIYVYVLAISENTIYAGTYSQGVFKSTNEGKTWSRAGLSGKEVDALAIDPTNPQIIYAGMWGHGVYKSTNGGGLWSAVNSGLGSDPYIYGLAIDPTDTKILYAATSEHGVYRSWNGGGSWTQEGLPGRIAYTVVVDAEGVAYAGTDGRVDGQGVYRRPVGGPWAAMNKQPDNLKVRSLVPCDPVLLAGTTDGAWWYGPD